ADIGLFHLVGGIPPDQVRAGLRVKAQWKPREEWDYTLENILYFTPMDEPDVELDDPRSSAHA
ncbi:MAG: DNA-binding protein, partial [Deltaproteobacteria bacterium]|nr:DNA-binding protein [Deltaproteobacteria bacterium]